MHLGDAFLMRIPRQQQRHLWFVISDPTIRPTFIIANVTTDAMRTGQECTLFPADHKWITKQCYVNFADALEITPQKIAKIQELLKMGSITMEHPLHPNVLRRVVDAARKSKAL